MNIDNLAKQIHAQNKEIGWWDSPRSILTLAQLGISEIGEATDADRKKKVDGHLTNREGSFVELGDLFIRTLDWAGHEGWLFDQTILPHKLLRETTCLPEMHFVLSCCVCELGKKAHLCSATAQYEYSRLISTILAVAATQYTLPLFFTVVREKIQYNRTRADHNRDNRAREHGKRY